MPPKPPTSSKSRKTAAAVPKVSFTQFADRLTPEFILAAVETTGQRCTSTSLVAIERSIHEEFIAKFHELSKKIIIDHNQKQN